MFSLSGQLCLTRKSQLPTIILIIFVITESAEKQSGNDLHRAALDMFLLMIGHFDGETIKAIGHWKQLLILRDRDRAMHSIELLQTDLAYGKWSYVVCY